MIHLPATSTSDQCEALCSGSAAALAELSAPLKAVTWVMGVWWGSQTLSGLCKRHLPCGQTGRLGSPLDFTRERITE